MTNKEFAELSDIFLNKVLCDDSCELSSKCISSGRDICVDYFNWAKHLSSEVESFVFDINSLEEQVTDIERERDDLLDQLYGER